MQIKRVGVRSERTNAGKIRNAAKTKISGSREAERTLDEKYLWEVILLYAGESFKPIQGFRSLMK